MKKFTKICLLISLCIACIGIICMCAGIALGSGPREVMEIADRGGLDVGNWHIGRWSIFYRPDDEDAEPEKDVLKAEFSQDEITSLDIDIKYGEVRLVDSADDKIRIDIDAPRRNSYSCENDGGVLELEDQTGSGWWRFTRNINKHVKVTVEIPEGKVFEQAKLVTNAGAVEIEHDLCAREVSLDLDAGELTAGSVSAEEEFSANVGAGRMEVSRFAAGELEVDCGMGEVEFRGSVGRDAEVKCGMGKISLELYAKEEDYDYEISCGLGEVDMNGRSFSSLSTDQEIQNNTGRTIRLDCGMGEINFTSNSKED